MLNDSAGSLPQRARRCLTPSAAASRLALGLTIALSMLGCSSQTWRASDPTPAANDGGAYFFDRVRSVREEIRLDVAGLPRHLLEALGCRPRPDLIPTSAIVLGTVTDVAPGGGVIWIEDEGTDDKATDTDFADPQADGRWTDLTVEVEKASAAPGGDVPHGTIHVRMDVLIGSDPDQFMASLGSVGEVLLLLATDESGRGKGAFYPALGGAGVGLVDPATRAVSFPGLGEGEASFVGGLEATPDALLAAAGAAGCS